MIKNELEREKPKCSILIVLPTYCRVRQERPKRKVGIHQLLLLLHEVLPICAWNETYPSPAK
jgi:hypothetical protein